MFEFPKNVFFLLGLHIKSVIKSVNIGVPRYLILIIIMLPLALQAQITAPGSRTVRYTAYPSDPSVEDPIFIYCNPTDQSRGTLEITPLAGTPPYNFTWHKWNNITGGFTDLMKTETGVPGSAMSDLEEGGYRITVTGGYDTTQVAWIVFDEPPVAEARLMFRDCYTVALDGTATATVAGFPYYDVNSGNVLSLKNELNFRWSSSPESKIPYPDIQIDPVIGEPPLEDVTYKLTVNTLGCSNETSFFYESIHVSAEFTAEPSEGEAPLEVFFTDNSVRASRYTWRFGDDSVSLMPDPGMHTFYQPGDYTVSLAIESDLTCRDSATVKVRVLPSNLNIPNVFTPNDDGINDYFVPEKQSLRYLNLQIFSKSGRRVYNYTGRGTELHDWQGWDGRINHSDRLAEPGAYFYILHAVGYDDVDYKGKEHRGTVYLYR